jgi:hypothetical protein
MAVKYLPKAEWGAGVLGDVVNALQERGNTAAPTSGGSTAGIDQILDLFNQQGLGGFGSSSSQGSSWGATPVEPPVLSILQEMRQRRDSLAQRQQIIADILAGNVPRGQTNYLGFEPGGVADILMGLISGEGPGAGARILPADQRRVRRQQLPVPGGEPSVGEEAGGAMSLAQQILNAIRVISTSGSQQTSGSSQGTTPAPAATSYTSPAPSGFNPRI